MGIRSGELCNVPILGGLSTGGPCGVAARTASPAVWPRFGERRVSLFVSVLVDIPVRAYRNNVHDPCAFGYDFTFAAPLE